eukprot:bmy_00507T0
MIFPLFHPLCAMLRGRIIPHTDFTLNQACLMLEEKCFKRSSRRTKQPHLFFQSKIHQRFLGSFYLAKKQCLNT